MPVDSGGSGSAKTSSRPLVKQPPGGVPHQRRMTVPVSRPGVVERSGLLAVLLASTASVVTVVAPLGYGKSTLLAQWADCRADEAAWVSCEDAYNDPVALWTAIIASLQRLAPPSWTAASDVLSQTGGEPGAVPALVAAFAGVPGRVLLVLDHVEAIRNRVTLAALAELSLRLPYGWQLALGSREAVRLPLSRLRMQDDLLEIGAAHLEMDPMEAAQLLDGAGVDATQAETEALVRQTEGWPAGLYLAALAMRSGTPTSGFAFTGDDRLMREYLRSELLTAVSPGQQDFLVRTSILDRLSGPLCDAVLGGTGSAHGLEVLESRNLLVMPADRRGEWYRYHPLLRDLLQSELRNTHPQLVRDLHLRAATWFEEHGVPEQAIGHAEAADAPDVVARLVLDVMQPVWASGRVETVRGWMDWLSAHSPSAYFPAIAAHGALIFALLGRAGEAERWSAAAESMPAKGVLPDGTTEEATLAYMRAILARQGPETCRRDAEAAMEGLGPLSPYRATMVHTVGLSQLLQDDLDAAAVTFVAAQELAEASGAGPLVSLVLAERHLTALGRGDLDEAEAHVNEALDIVEGGRLESFWSSALVLAVAARSSSRHGRFLEARRYLRRAIRLRPLLTHVLPVVSVQALLELTRAYLELVDPAGARAVLDQAGRILLRRPDLGNLGREAQLLRSRLDQVTKSPAAGVSSLTAAELRLLPLLSTHLSFPAIAEQLSLSRNTVKSQVASVYRKLGVASRSEAVERLVQLGIAG